VRELSRWTDPSQPQTLQAAVLFSYLNAGLAILTLILSGPGPSLLIVLGGLGAKAMANDRRWGYYLAIAIAILFLLLQLIFIYPVRFSILFNILFAGVLVALLLHPQSRTYARTWFH
jgi:hypothetical protein